MIYCRIHSCNNCIQCALQRQTEAIVEAIRATQPPPKQPWWKRLVTFGRQA